jgi:hypothetical protein
VTEPVRPRRSAARAPQRASATPVLGLAVLLAAVGCRSPTATETRSELLPRPGARVALGEFSNGTSESFDVDAVGLLHDAMAEALAHEGLAAPAGTAGGAFVLGLAITEYRPGNAFQRWLLPGYGSTILAVEGTLTDAASGALAAHVVHRRSVHWGGAYTIGAWRSIFGEVAGDIAADLRVRIEQGGEFVVTVTPRAEQAPAAEPAADALAVRVAEVADARAERGRIGERRAAFGVAMGDVHLSRRASDVVREALIDDLLAGGRRVVASGEDLVATPALRRFWVHTDTTALYWDVVAEIELELAVQAPGKAPARRSFACRQVERTWVWPTAVLTGRVLDRCLAELGTKLRSDSVWVRDG